MLSLYFTVTVLSKMVREINIQTQLEVDEEAWPPEPPKTFTPLVLIQHGHHNLEQSTAMAEFVERGHVDKVVSVTKTDILPKGPKLNSHQALQEVLDTSKPTKEVTDILAPLETSDDPQFILIEGAPGIGKSFLLKHIAYLWGIQKSLQKFKLVLLVRLRDLAAQKMSLIDDLFQSFCRRDRRATEIASACSDYLSWNNGEDLALLFDGYDEYPERLRKDSLIADILKRKVLPRCSLVVSSRPHASASLQQKATVRVDILGFTEAGREDYIKESMQGQPQKIDKLTQYLQVHSTISSLCFVPLNLVVLVYLYKLGFSLPKNSAELYDYFICFIICRYHLNKYDHPLQGNITKLTDLPEPYNKIIQQLSKLSLEALNDNKLIFTLEEINEACPDLDIAAIPNCCGLLQAVEHFGFTRKITTIHFLHFSIQEYLAAYRITNLPADEELRIIEDKFLNDSHFNMFSIYVSLTKGQRPSFKHFLCGGNKAIGISDKFLNNQLQCLRLYQCFREAGNVDICKTIEQSVTFSDKKIDLRHITLPSNVECVTVFLTSSSYNEWVELNFFNCYIQDHGLHILYRGLLHCRNITIDQVVLKYNGLTKQSSSWISDITVKCQVKKLWISGNYTIGEDEKLYSMLSNSSTMLEELYMWRTKLSSRAAIALFTAVMNNNKLKVLDIGHNSITNDAHDAIATALERNSCLIKLYMYGTNCSPLTGEAILSIVNALKVNNTLELLWLPKCPGEVKKTISSLQEVINKNRESRGCQVKLRIQCF